jgi:hypothetical protein
MNNLIRLSMLAVIVGVVGMLTYMAWDQLALTYNWPRPLPGAGIGVVFLALVFNVLWHNHFMIGGHVAHPNSATNPEAS